MSRALGAGALYFAGMFGLGFVLGTLRVLVITPRFGEWAATLAELPLMLGVSWLYCSWLLQRFSVSARAAERLAMGAFAFALLMVAEVLLGVGLFDRGPAEQVREMTSGPGLAGLIGQLAFACFPMIQLSKKWWAWQGLNLRPLRYKHQQPTQICGFLRFLDGPLT